MFYEKNYFKTYFNECWRGCGEKGTLCTIGGNVNWYSYYRRQFGDSLKHIYLTPGPIPRGPKNNFKLKKKTMNF